MSTQVLRLRGVAAAQAETGFLPVLQSLTLLRFTVHRWHVQDRLPDTLYKERGLHDFCPVVFDECHFCLLNLAVHSVPWHDLLLLSPAQSKCAAGRGGPPVPCPPCSEEDGSNQAQGRSCGLVAVRSPRLLHSSLRASGRWRALPPEEQRSRRRRTSAKHHTKSPCRLKLPLATPDSSYGPRPKGYSRPLAASRIFLAVHGHGSFLHLLADCPGGRRPPCQEHGSGFCGYAAIRPKLFRGHEGGGGGGGNRGEGRR